MFKKSVYMKTRGYKIWNKSVSSFNIFCLIRTYTNLTNKPECGGRMRNACFVIFLLGLMSNIFVRILEYGVC